MFVAGAILMVMVVTALVLAVRWAWERRPGRWRVYQGKLPGGANEVGFWAKRGSSTLFLNLRVGTADPEFACKVMDLRAEAEQKVAAMNASQGKGKR